MLSCSFCNLNLQWQGYREKPTLQSLADIQYLADRHEICDFTIVDNILRHHQVDEYIQGLQGLDGGYDFWLEARASVRPAQIRGLSEAGGRVIQFGIEALSSSILKKIVKGTTTILNLQAMKFCEQYGVKNTANLIVDYPGIDEADIHETLRNIEFARGYRPLDIADFSLVHQSPVHKFPENYGIRNIRNHQMYALLMPSTLNSRLVLTEKTFDCDQLDGLRPLWQKVKQALDDWHEHYARMRPLVEGNLLLSLQDGGRYLKIRDFRHAQPRFYWLRDAERDVYLECSEIVTLSSLYTRFPSIAQSTIDAWLAQWLSHKLIFAEGKKVLALAVPWGPLSEKRSVYPLADTGQKRSLTLSH
jgi:radical SAM superfamily enzyme YgiQ (UPF0313 family)